MKARIAAAAAALCKQASTDSGLEYNMLWANHLKQFIEDAKAALKAADDAAMADTRFQKRQIKLQKECIERLSAQKMSLESELRAYRVKYGVIGSLN
jgi:hypothetical protein